MVWLRRVTGCWSNTLVLHVEALGGRQVLLRRVPPKLFAHLYVQVLRKGLSQTVRQSLDHDVVVVVALFEVLLAQFLLLETC